jgi:hypothetical protein
MPRLRGYKEKNHQPLWDTLIRTYSTTHTDIVSPTKLFGNANVGTLSMTNLAVAGQLASNQSFVILSFRVWLFFNGTNRRALYLGCASQLFWTVTLGEKPQFQAPTWYMPAGGGTYGFDSGTSMFNNGDPSQAAILKLARPIVIPPQQNISVEAAFYAIGTEDVLATINTGTSDDTKVITFMIDGQKTRDVQ